MPVDSVTVAFELMTLELDTAVEDLNSEGAKQFRASNYDEAARLTERGKALREFYRKVVALSDEWTENFAEPSDNVLATPEATHAARQILSASKSAKTGLMVRFPDGAVICEPKAAMTLAKVIERIGFEKVRALGIQVNKENIVSLTPSPTYNEVHLPPYYVKTHSSTDQKKKNLERIAGELSLALHVSIIE